MTEITRIADKCITINTKNRYFLEKRGFDIVVSALGIAMLSPLLLLIAASVKIDDEGPIIYKQKRLTKDGKVFEIYKFRTMRDDAAKERQSLIQEEDNRITEAGRFLRNSHLDELPQLWNVLKGDMSMVGPRPELPELTEQYCKAIPEFRQRLIVKAGLTGYAQVYCDNNDDPAEKLKFDLKYIDNMSLTKDLQIVVATIKMMLTKTL